MAEIRPPAWPVVANPTRESPKSDARTAAQRAFFQAALANQTGAPAAPQPVRTPVQTPAPAAAPARTAKAPDLTIQMPEEPQKILRPGSIIDIRV